jgi:DNA polymerase I-like protein with 3'-5' exonuclease and polymerase domains
MERELVGQSHLVFDLETSGLAWYRDAKAVGAAFATWDQDGYPRCWYIPFRHRTGERQVPIDFVLSSVRYLLSRAGLVIGHNLKFDEHFSHKEGWFIENRYDTMVAGALFNENVPLKLETRVERHLGIKDTMKWNQLVQAEIFSLARNCGLKKTEYLDLYGYSEVPINLLGIYACHDVLYTAFLYDFFERRHRVSSTYTRVWPTEMELIRVLGDMERHGLLVDRGYVESLRDALSIARNGFALELAKELGKTFRPGSDHDVSDLLYKKYHFPVIKRTKKYQPSVDKEVLLYFSNRLPILRELQSWRDVDKLLNTYTTSILKRTDTNDICHTDFQQVGTNTGRMASRSPNFQNFPTDDSDRKKQFGGVDPWSIRRAFIARGPKHPRLFFDYSQVELRMLAYFTRDPIMHDVFLSDGDIHDRTQKEVGVVLRKEVERRKAKVVNFGLCIAEGQKVLTHCGLVPIEKVTIDHLVWDGLDWVSHSGIVCRGTKEVITYDGITATSEHEVYLENGQRAAIGVAASGMETSRIAIGGNGEVPVRFFASNGGDTDAIGWEPKEACEVYSSEMSDMWASEVGFGDECSWGSSAELFLSAWEIFRSTCEDIGSALRCYGTTLLSEYACFITSLQRAWHKSFVSLERTFYSMGFEYVSGQRFSGFGFRSDRQRWPLFTREFEASNEVRKFEKLDGCQTRRVARVYDILNAGSRRRFTVEGKIVSNSYCLTAMGLARQAQMSLQDAERFLAAFEARYAGIPAFRERFWSEIRGRKNHWFQNLWGRRRRLPLIASHDKRLRSRAERQAIGTLIQGQAAELTKESLVRLDRVIKRLGLPVHLCNVVHDDIQMDCPVDALAETCSVVKPEMERYPEFAPIPIKVDGDYTTTSWAEKHKLPL